MIAITIITTAVLSQSAAPAVRVECWSPAVGKVYSEATSQPTYKDGLWTWTDSFGFQRTTNAVCMVTKEPAR